MSLVMYVRNMCVCVCICVFWLCLSKPEPNLKKVSNPVWLVRRTLKYPVNESTQEGAAVEVSQETRLSESPRKKTRCSSD